MTENQTAIQESVDSTSVFYTHPHENARFEIVRVVFMELIIIHGDKTSFICKEQNRFHQ